MISTIDMAMSFIFTLSTKQSPWKDIGRNLWSMKDSLGGLTLQHIKKFWNLFFAFNNFAKEDLNISLEKALWFYG